MSRASPNLVLLLGFAVGLAAGCAKKKGDDGSTDSAVEEPGSTVVAGGQPEAGQGNGSGSIGSLPDGEGTESLPAGSPAPAPAPSATETVDTDGIDATMSGLPSDPSAATNLNVTVGGTNVTHYKFAVVASGSGCGSVSYGAWTPVANPITQSLAGDGLQTLCVLAMGGSGDDIAITALSHTWLKDTAAPAVAVDPLGALGPESPAGAFVVVTGTGSDGGSGLQSAGVSVQAGAGNCLNGAATAFDQPCPHYLPPTSGDTSWTLTVPKAVFADGTTYTFSARTIDQAGNASTPASRNATWDSTPPATAATADAVTAAGGIAVDWSAVAGSDHFLVIRRRNAAVTHTPVAGQTYAVNQSLGSNQIVAYVDATHSFLDTNDVDPFVTYHYKVYTVDAAGNLSTTGVAASGYADRSKAFAGISFASLVGGGRLIRVEWKEFTDGSFPLASMAYDVFVASSPGGQDFGGAPAASVTGADSLVFADGGSSSTLYLVVKQRKPDGSTDGNTVEFALNLGSGTVHRIAGTERRNGASALSPESYLLQPVGESSDAWGNIVFQSGNGVVSVYCAEVAAAPYCIGRTAGNVYHLIGADGLGNAEDNVPAVHSPIGYVYGLDVDQGGNVFLADHTNFKIRVACFEPNQPGFCFGKTRGQLYHIAGYGTQGDGIDGIVAKTAQIGNPMGVAVDGDGNVFVADQDYAHTRLICANISGACSGRFAGYHYRFAGATTAADGADDSVQTTGHGVVYAIDADAFGNVYLADYTYFRIRAICRNVTAGAGFCAGKTTGHVYRVAGTGANGNAAHDVPAAAESIGRSYGLKVDALGNLWYSDSDQRRIRAICFKVDGGGYCQGRSAGNIFHVAGDGTNVDGGNGVLAITAPIGDPRSLAVTPQGQVVFSDLTRLRLRVICNVTGAGDACDSQSADNLYYFAGTSGANAGSDDLPGISSTLGTLRGTAVDAYDNIYFSDITGNRIRVLCNDPAAAACAGKTVGNVYTVAGNGTLADTSDDAPATSAIGDANGVVLDGNGNVYFSDASYRRIRVVCFDVTAAGFCNGRTAGNMYRLAGTGAQGDGANDALAATTAMGTPNSLAFDSFGNLFVADGTYRRVRTICLNASGGFCAGKTADKVYRFAGTGTNADGDTGAAASVDMGVPNQLAVDAEDNVFFADATYRRIRVVCQGTTLGFCNGKTTGTIYRVAGIGSAADGATDADASSTAMGTPNGLIVDAHGNLFVGDASYFRVRAICWDVASPGYCESMTAGNVYRMTGTGATGDDAANKDYASARTGGPNLASMAKLSDGSFVFSDTYNAMKRLIP